jgi:hypothetical protein
MEPTGRIVDVTDMTPAAFEVFLSAACGEAVTVAHLNPAERRSVVEALGLTVDARTYAWIND